MPLLSDYMLEHGLSDESMAEVLSEKLGRQITPHGVLAQRNRKDKNLSKSWLEALEIERPEFIRESEVEEDLGGSPAQAGEHTGAGDDAARTSLAPVELPFDGLEAKTRIKLIYELIGKGVSRGMKDPRYEMVFRQHAPVLADKWIAAAKQNRQVATIVTYITAGGATGDLVIAHLTLVMSMLIISGKVPIGGIRNLGPDVVDTTATERQQESSENGAGPEDAGTVRAVADDAEASA